MNELAKDITKMLCGIWRIVILHGNLPAANKELSQICRLEHHGSNPRLARVGANHKVQINSLGRQSAAILDNTEQDYLFLHF